MKTIVIGKQGRELGRYQLSKDNILIGRSPVCDLVLRATYIEPVHYWLEYVSGSTDIDEDDSGLWTLMNIAEGGASSTKSNLRGSFSGEGVVLGDERIEFSGLEFEIIKDRLQSTDIKRGVLKREIERGSEVGAVVHGHEEVLSVIYYRKDIDIVSNISYLDKSGPGKKRRICPSIKGAYFLWDVTKPKAHASGTLVLPSNTDLYQVSVFDREHKLQLQLTDGAYKVEVSAHTFIKVRTSHLDYILRFVPKFPVTLAEASPFKDPALRVALFVVCFVAFIGWLSQFVRPQEDQNDVPKRIATVVIKEEKLVKPIPPNPPLPVPPPKVEPVKVEPPKVEPPKVESMAKGQASAPQIVNSVSNKAKAGINSPAPITNVNSVGLLGKLKAKKSAGTLSADAILNQGVVTDTVAASTGFVVNRSAGGVVGSGKIKDDALSEASTTLSNSMAADPSATGVLAISGGKGKFAYGLGKDGSGIGGRGDGLGNNNSESLEVAGGLDKDAVRAALAENRRALRNCYESALLTKSKLEGKLVMKWQISPKGSVSSTRLVSTTLNTPQFEACIENVISGILFQQAASGQPTTVIYPFVFQGKK